MSDAGDGLPRASFDAEVTHGGITRMTHVVLGHSAALSHAEQLAAGPQQRVCIPVALGSLLDK